MVGLTMKQNTDLPTPMTRETIMQQALARAAKAYAPFNPGLAQRFEKDAEKWQKEIMKETLTSPNVVKEIMCLFGAETVPRKQYDKAVNLVRAIWRDGYSVGASMQKKKPTTMKQIKAIIYKDKPNRRTE